MPGPPLLDRAVTLALGVGEVPGHVGEADHLDSGDLHDAGQCVVVVDQGQAFADVLQLLAFFRVLGEPPAVAVFTPASTRVLRVDRNSPGVPRARARSSPIRGHILPRLGQGGPGRRRNTRRPAQISWPA